MRKILLALFLLPSLLFISSASAADTSLPPSEKCMAIYTQSKYSYIDDVPAQKIINELVSADCMSNPYDLTEEYVKDWNTTVCDALVPEVNSFIGSIDYASLDKEYYAALKNISKKVRAQYGVKQKRLNKAYRKLYNKSEQELKLHGNTEKLRRINHRLNVFSKKQMNISRIINKKISSDPAFKQSTKNLIEAFYNTSYADLVIYTNGCMLDPDLKNFDKYNPNQEKFDDFAYRFGQIQDTSRDLMGYTNTAYKALKADSVGTGSFKFDARQALQAIQRSEGSKFVKEYFRIGGYKTFKANVKSGKALNKIYIQSSKNRQRICFRMAYKYGTTTQVMSASVKSNGISWYEGPNCKDPYVDQADKGFK